MARVLVINDDGILDAYEDALRDRSLAWNRIALSRVNESGLTTPQMWHSRSRIHL